MSHTLNNANKRQCIGAHKYIRQFCGDPRNPECPVDEIVTFHKEWQRKSSTKEQGTATDAQLDDVTSCISKQLDALLQTVDLRRERTQVTVSNPSSCHFGNVHPILDVLCVDKKGTPVPVEVKTGKVRRLRKMNKNDTGAKGALSAFADTLALRHHAQLAVQIECLRNWGGRGKGFLLYVQSCKKLGGNTFRLKLTKINKDVLNAVAQTDATPPLITTTPRSSETA
jgi:hypothetical protein